MGKKGSDKAAVDAHRFMAALHELEVWLQVLSACVQDALQRNLGVSLKTAHEWLAKRGQTAADRFVSGVEELLESGLVVFSSFIAGYGEAHGACFAPGAATWQRRAMELREGLSRAFTTRLRESGGLRKAANRLI